MNGFSGDERRGNTLLSFLFAYICSQKRNMISLTEAKKILNKGERKYTDEEVNEILRTLSFMAEMQIETDKYWKERATLLNDKAGSTQ